MTLKQELFTYFVQTCPESEAAPIAVQAKTADEAAHAILRRPVMRTGKSGQPIAVVWREGPGTEKIYFYREDDQ